MNGLHLINKNIRILVLAGLIALTLLLPSFTALATLPSGLTAEPVVSGTLTEPVRLKFKDGEGGFEDGVEVRKLTVVKYTVVPGGTFGWHRHGGPVWAIVKSGTLSIYSGDDPTCTPQKYSAGSAFLDPGNHTHLGINETTEPVEVYAAFMLPEGGLPRLDAADPGVCN